VILLWTTSSSSSSPPASWATSARGDDVYAIVGLAFFVVWILGALVLLGDACSHVVAVARG